MFVRHRDESRPMNELARPGSGSAPRTRGCAAPAKRMRSASTMTSDGVTATEPLRVCAEKSTAADAWPRFSTNESGISAWAVANETKERRDNASAAVAVRLMEGTSLTWVGANRGGFGGLRQMFARGVARSYI